MIYLDIQQGNSGAGQVLLIRVVGQLIPPVLTWLKCQ